jgi:hypothetical protein
MHLKCQIWHICSKCSSVELIFLILPPYIYACLLYHHTTNSAYVCFMLYILISLINLLICRIMTLMVGDSEFVFQYLFIYSAC